MPTMKLAAAALAAFWMLGVSAGAARAADKTSADLQVWVIRATTKNNDISPELKKIAEQLKKQFKYTGFKLERTITGKAEMGKKFSSSLVGAYSLELTPKRHDGERVQLQVDVFETGKDKKKKRCFSATVTLAVGQFQLFGGWSLGGGDALILAVAAK